MAQLFLYAIFFVPLGGAMTHKTRKCLRIRVFTIATNYRDKYFRYVSMVLHYIYMVCGILEEEWCRLNDHVNQRF